ncbi:TolC family outer membrane protein, partial [Halomonas sp.]
MTPHRTLRRALLPALIASTFALPLQAADLLTITRDALEYNAQLAAARSQTDSVAAGRDVQRADLLPQVDVSSDVTQTRDYQADSSSSSTSTSSDLSALGGVTSTSGLGVEDDRFTTTSLSLNATQALFDARNRREVNRAESALDQQIYQLAATEQQVLIDVSSAYFEILRAYEVLEARRAQERAIGRQLEQTREQFEVGLIAITDVEEARARFDQARAERIAAESDLQVNFEALERLTGKRYESIESLQAALPVEPPSPSGRDQWVALAMENSPLILAQQAGVEISRDELSISRAERLPVVEAFANYRYSDGNNQSYDDKSSRSQLGVSVSLPLYTGGRTSADIRRSTFDLESSQYNLEDQRRSTIQQVRSRYTQVSNDVLTVEARAQAIVSNRSALEATRAGYEVGTRNIVDVLNAEQNLYSAVANYAEARYDYVIDLLTLRQQA